MADNTYDIKKSFKKLYNFVNNPIWDYVDNDDIRKLKQAINVYAYINPDILKDEIIDSKLYNPETGMFGIGVGGGQSQSYKDLSSYKNTADLYNIVGKMMQPSTTTQSGNAYQAQQQSTINALPQVNTANIATIPTKVVKTTGWGMAGREYGYVPTKSTIPTNVPSMRAANETKASQMKAMNMLSKEEQKLVESADRNKLIKDLLYAWRKTKKIVLGSEEASAKNPITDIFALMNVPFKTVGTISNTARHRTDMAAFEWLAKNKPEVLQEYGIKNLDDYLAKANDQTLIPLYPWQGINEKGLQVPAGARFREDVESYIPQDVKNKIMKEVYPSTIKDVINPKIESPDSMKKRVEQLAELNRLQEKANKSEIGLSPSELKEANDIINELNKYYQREDLVQGWGFRDIIANFAPELAVPYAPFTQENIEKVATSDRAKRDPIFAMFAPAALQIAGSVVGSPADLAGLAGEIYLLGNIGKVTPKYGTKAGSDTYVRLTKDLVDKNGKTILPKGSKVALSDVGREVMGTAVDSPMRKYWDDLLKTTMKSQSKIKKMSAEDILRGAFGSEVNLSSKAAKDLLKSVEAAQKSNIWSKAAEVNVKAFTNSLYDLASKSTKSDFMRLLDRGGIKLAGKTVVPGYKIEQVVKPLKTFMEDTKFKGKAFEKFSPSYLLDVFSTSKNMSPEIYALKQYAESFGRAYTQEGTEIINRIIRNLGSKDRLAFEKALGLRRDIALLSEQGAKIKNQIDDLLRAGASESDDVVKALLKEKAAIEKKIAEGQKLMPKLNQRTEQAIERWHKELSQKHIYGTESQYIQYPQTPEYTTMFRKQDVNMNEKVRRFFLGSEEQYFQKQYKPGSFIDAVKKGTYKDVFYTPEEAMQIRLRAGGKAIERNIFLDEIKKFGISQGELGLASPEEVMQEAMKVSGKKVKPLKSKLPDDFVPLKDPSGRIIPETSGYYFHKDIAKAVNRYNEIFFGNKSFQQVLGIFDKATNIWKRLALATPGYQWRNYMSDTLSGIMQWGMKYLDMDNWIKAYKIRRAQRYGGKYAKEKIRIGNKVDTAGNWAKKFRYSGISGTGKQVIESSMNIMDMFQASESAISPIQQMSKLGAVREDISRIVGAITELEGGADLIRAASMVKKVFFDYTDLATADQAIKRFVYPFWTWTRKNIPRQVELLFTQTPRYATIPRIQQYLTYIAGGEPPYYQQYRQDYLSELGGVFMKGNQTLALDLPYLDLNLLNPVSFAENFVSGANPYLKAVIENLFGKELFTGREITHERTEKAPDIMQLLIADTDNGYRLAKALGMDVNYKGELYVSPFWNYIWRLNPALQNLARAYNPSDTEKWKTSLQSILFGIKTVPYDELKQAVTYYNNKQKEMTERLQTLRIQNENNPNIVIPEADELTTALRQYYKEVMEEKYNVKTINDIRRAAKLVGSNKSLDLYLDLMEKPYKEEVGKMKGLDEVNEMITLLQMLNIPIDLDRLTEIIQQNRV